MHGPERASRAVMWCLVALAFANAVLHVRAVNWSLIASDNWTMIHPFLADAIAGRLDLGNFLVRRAGVDHAQPLNKLVMWLNYRYFGLDFMLEGFLAMAFGLAALLVLYRAMVAEDSRATRPPSFYLAFAAVAGVFYSLNSSFIYTYSMVTMWYAVYLLAFLMLVAGWHALRRGVFWPLAAATFALGIVGDDSVYLDAAALVLALLFYGARGNAMRRAWQAVAVIAVAVLLSRGVYWAFGETSGTTQAMFNQPLTARIEGLAAQWRDAWTWFAVPASSGLLAGESLHGLAGEHASTVRASLALLLLVAHAWFWWAALRLRPGAAWLAATMLMLMFYAHVAAILVARIFVKGAPYLDQPRYVSFYQFGIIALLLMGMAWVLQRPDARYRRWLAAAAFAVLLVQVPATYLAKHREPRIDAHNRLMAMSMAAVARDPLHPPAGCPLAMNLCTLPLERRIELLRLLRDNRLSLFSPQYARRHPEDAAAVALATEGR
ncbi:MAG: hypothetical protein H7Y19_18190 [Luteimonas sp.]|nr:hypothetical protein [Luteimonas sp.]